MPRHSGLPKLVPAQGGGPKDNPTTNTSSQHTKAPLRPPALPNTPSRLGGPPAPVRAELLAGKQRFRNGVTEGRREPSGPGG